MSTLTTGAMRLPPRLRASVATRTSPSRPALICRACLTSRPFSSSSTTSPAQAAYARLASRRLISVSGPDAAKYLQGVITSNIAQPDGSARTAGFYSAFLNAQGRVLHDVFVYPAALGGADPAESFLVEVDAAEAERLVRHIKRYKLRAKFAVRLLDGEEGRVWHAWDDSGSGLEAIAASGELKGGSIVLRDPRSPTLGYRIVSTASPAAVPELGAELDEAEEEKYQIRRYLHGIPEGQSEILYETALPLESNMDVMGGIDFHKGCYVGQELTIRTKHRGVVRKRILPCVLYGEGDGEVKPQDRELAYQSGITATEDNAFRSAEEIPAGTSIGRVGKKGRSAGKWLRGVGNVGLALCRLEIMTDVVLPGEANSSAFNPTDEFVLAEKLEEGQEGVGRQARVKAFVPLWLRQGLDGAISRQ
ncbi:Aminomethyltransferase folate-binding domain-containing protein [Coniochaeta ligniaria NRRL 30616]|uniref:Iron-sulfur cluster assembly factor IBA57 homolog, mitochondrial n=1 Tax=Coniochaeta ligniaria NRRL 30616 TaxID=1408157 RepID=A0A1J7JV92_9PEZI|nr:Aminomethyltransferase folate-binding domain-containing protein [Coniochaeta ligniaria NRRL 30616]